MRRLIALLFLGVTVIARAQSPTVRTFPQKQIAEGIVVVPSALTALTTTDTVVFQITVSNITAGAVTLLVEDTQSTPGQLLPTVSLAAHTSVTFSFPSGVKLIGGLQWQASAGTSLHAEVFGFSK